MENDITLSGYNSVFATRFRELMNEKKDEKKVTQQAIADVIGGSRQVISQYMNGLVTPQIDKLEKIADFFNVSCDYLLGRTNVKTIDTSIQAICEATGLSEEAIEQLILLNSQISEVGDVKIKGSLKLILLNKLLSYTNDSSDSEIKTFYDVLDLALKFEELFVYLQVNKENNIQTLNNLDFDMECENKEIKIILSPNIVMKAIEKDMLDSFASMLNAICTQSWQDYRKKGSNKI